jgi:hypothetical protein
MNNALLYDKMQKTAVEALYEKRIAKVLERFNESSAIKPFIS